MHDLLKELNFLVKWDLRNGPSLLFLQHAVNMDASSEIRIILRLEVIQQIFLQKGITDFCKALRMIHSDTSLQ